MYKLWKVIQGLSFNYFLKQFLLQLFEIVSFFFFIIVIISSSSSSSKYSVVL